MVDESIVGVSLQGLDRRLVHDPFELLEKRISILPESYIKICFDFFTPSDIIKGNHLHCKLVPTFTMVIASIPMIIAFFQ